MKRFLLLLIIGSCVFSLNLSAQNSTSWPKTLLWRISGNGLTKNSYLYGTMHLQDKRIFYFSDSLYHSLEQADGYAMEIDLKEMMDTLMMKWVNDDDEEKIDKKRLANKSERKKIIDSLLQNVKLRNDKTSKKILNDIQDDMTAKAKVNKEMPTVMDAYLFGIAKKKGKWVGGIEDVQDQLSLDNEFGAEVTSDEFMAPDAVVTASIEQMIQMYLAKDLDKIEAYSTSHYSDEMEDKVLTNRNIKMAWRMDSLAKVRSMFFAVGAAHLPGDSGVITLLRKRGFRVDPIFSGKKIDPFVYSSKLPELPWLKIEDEKKIYSVEMPGEPMIMDVAGDIKMQLCMDIFTLNVYLATGGVLTGAIKPENVLASYSQGREATILTRKDVEYKGMKGIEAVMYSDGYHLKIRYLVKENRFCMQVMAAEKRTTLESKEAKKFFESLVLKPFKPGPTAKWTALELKDKGITVFMPGAAKRNFDSEKDYVQEGWRFTIYDYTNEEQGIYLMLQVKDIEPGYHMTADSILFSNLRETVGREDHKVIKDTVFKIGNYPACYHEEASAANEILYKVLLVSRGNRIYTLYANCINEANMIEQANNFINRAVIKENRKSVWRKEELQGSNFYTSAPAPIVLDTDTAGNINPGVQLAYYSFDPTDNISYQLYKEVLSPYYWTNSDSAFFEYAASDYKTWEDSVWSRQEVTNGTLKGMEWVIQIPGFSNLKKIRQLVNGDTIYTIISFIPSWSIHDNEKKKYFEDFRIINTVPATYFNSKAEKILTDIQSRDSATFFAASAAFDDAEFEPKHKKLLEQALLRTYADDSADIYYDQRSKIMNKLTDMSDDATIKFIHDNYASLTGDKEYVKYDALEFLAKKRTAYSYQVLKELLLTNPPRVKRTKQLSYWITDSIKLTRTLYPEILQLSSNPFLAKRIMDITRDMLDGGAFNMNMVMPYRKNMLHTADTLVKSLKAKTQDEYYGIKYVDVIGMVRYFRDDEANKLLQQYLLLPDMEIKRASAIALLMNDQVVDKKQLEAIAADRVFRTGLYDELVEMGQQKLFPAKYLSQQYFAESILWDFSDDYYPLRIEFIKGKTMTYKGSQKRFYLFRLEYSNDDEEGEPQVYLGVAGPYSPDPKKVKIEDDSVTTYLEYDPEKIDEALTEYLKILEEETEE